MYLKQKNLILMIRSSENIDVRAAEIKVLRWIEENSDMDTMLDFSNNYMNEGAVEMNKKIHAKTPLVIFKN